ncbi:TonB-dependent receptor, partial [bacterium]|nr:TonB-dependent receptor [bacterium]
VLYDGIPESEPDGQARLEAIDPGTIDRVEVLRGGGSALYGNAAGGVVNFRTPETLPVPGVRAEVIASGYGYSKLSLTAGTGQSRRDSAFFVSFDFGNLRFGAGQPGGEGGIVKVSRTVADGWREHSAYEGYNVYGTWTVHASAKSSLRTLLYFISVYNELPGTLTREQFEADPFQADSNYVALDVRRITRKGRLGLQYTRRFSDRISVEFVPYVALKYFDRPGDDKTDYRLITRYMLGGTLQGQWNGFIAGRMSKIVAGIDQQFQDGPISRYENLNGSRGDSLLKEERKAHWAQGAFAEAEMSVNDRVTVSAGARWDKVRYIEETLTAGERLTNDEQAVTPRFGLRYRISPDMLLFGSIFGGFETPSRKELENSTGFDVKPQKTWTTELGARSVGTTHGITTQWEVTMYRMVVTDMIVPDVLAGEELFTNAGEAVHQGIELSALLSRPRLGFVGLAASFGEYCFTDYVTAFGDFSNKKLPGVSPDLIRAVVRWMPDDLFYAECSARTSGAAWVNIENSEKADGWAVINAAIGGELPVDFLSGSWYVTLNNITDQRYAAFIQVNDSAQKYYEMGMPRTVVMGFQIASPGL